MNILIELCAELFSWFGLGQAEKKLKEGNKTRAFVLTALFLIILMAIVIYIAYGIIKFIKTY